MDANPSARRSGRRFFFCPRCDKTVTPSIILSVEKQKGQFGAMHRDCFAVSETFSRNLGQNRSLILLAKWRGNQEQEKFF